VTTGRPVVVDLSGMPSELRVPGTRGRRWLGGLMVAIGVLQVVLALTGDVSALLAVVWGVYLVSGIAYLAGGAGRVTLQPEGFRRGDALWRGRLRPWSRVRDVRPAGPWSEHPQLLGSRASDRPVPLVGMDAEQAERLRVRLVDGRARAERGATR